jgi:serine/threonine protein kinase
MEGKTKVWSNDTKAVDMWSMGVCRFEILNFYKPFDEKLPITQYIQYDKKQRNREFRFDKPIADVISKQIKHLVHRLLEPKPGIRIKAEEALFHPGLALNFLHIINRINNIL